MKPKLRFKNFNNDWINCTIKDVADVIGGGTPDTSNSKFWNGDINWFTPSEVGKSKYVSNSERKITELGVQKSSAKLLPIGAILLSSRATVGEASILEKNQACTNQGFQSLVAHKNIDTEFLYYLKDKYKKEMLNKAFGSTFLEISKSNIEKIKIKIPSIEEQTKISNFLSLLDKKIELQSKKIEDLKLFKLYIRNNLNISSKEKIIKLKELVYCNSSNTTLNDIENDDGIYPIYGATGLIKNISRYSIDKKYIAIVKDGAGVGRTIICNEKSSILATMNALIPKDNYPINYVCELINTIKFNKYVVGSGIPHIYFKDYGNEELKIHDIKTANKISRIFKCLDKKIILLNNQLNKLNELKKGLMQNMFV